MGTDAVTLMANETGAQRGGWRRADRWMSERAGNVLGMPHLEFDSAQSAVIDLPSGQSASVIGAPGTGKTESLIARVAALVEQRDAVDEVLALSPSRATATSLRSRLAVRVKRATSGPLAQSIASFAFAIVTAEARRVGRADPVLLTGPEQDRVLGELLEVHAADDQTGSSAWPARLPAVLRASAAFRSELREFLTDAADLDVTSADLNASEDPAWHAVGSMMAEYRDALRGAYPNGLDTAELYRSAAEIIRDHPAAIRHLRDVVVDDAQELTRAGTRLIEALRARGVGVVVFGDPDVSSGAFRGATPARFAELVASLVDVHVLDQPYRANGDIVWATRALTGRIGAAGRIDHRRAPGTWRGDGTLQLQVASSTHAEWDDIAAQLRQRHLDDGVAWGAMAVIVRDAHRVEMYADELAAREVPTRTFGVQRPLRDDPAVGDLLHIVRVALTDAPALQPEDFARALLSPFGGMHPVQLRRLRAALRHREWGAGGARSAGELLFEAMTGSSPMLDFDDREAKAARRMRRTLEQVAMAARDGASVHELLWLVWSRARHGSGEPLADAWRETALRAGADSGATTRSLDALVALFDRAKRFVERTPEASAMAFVDDVMASEIPQDTLAEHGALGTVAVLTPAGALGAQYDVVVVAGVHDGVWPNLRLRGQLLGGWRLGGDDAERADRRRGVLADELRLFVRAISRARRAVILSCAQDEDHQPSVFLRTLLPDDHAADGESDVSSAQACTPADGPISTTLRGEVARLRRILTADADAEADAAQTSAARDLAALAERGVPGARPDEWYGVREVSTTLPLADPMHGVRVSPSQIATMEECELSWVLAALGATKSGLAGAGFGTVVHAALEAADGGDLTKMRAVLNEQWSVIDFEAPWHERKERVRAEDYLERVEQYLASVSAQHGELIGAEVPFEYVVTMHEQPRALANGEAVDGPHALVRGVIDRVERYPRGGGDDKLARGIKMEPIRPRDDDVDHVVVVADLKTGRSEGRTTDNSVADDPQLAAYQVAMSVGALDGVQSSEVAGARLVVISHATAKSRYRVSHQHTLDDEALGAFLRRVADVAARMGGPQFEAAVESHCQLSFAETLCRIHTIPPVSAS